MIYSELSIIENPGLIYDPKDHSFYDLKDGQLLAKKMTTEQEQQKNVFKELYKIDLEASSLSIKEISKDDQVLSYYLEQNKDGTKKGITLKKSDFGKLKPIFQEISEK